MVSIPTDLEAPSSNGKPKLMAPSSKDPPGRSKGDSARQKRTSGGGSNGALVSVVLSICLFLSLLQLFDPSIHETTPSAVEMGLTDFSRGRVKEPFKDVTHEKVTLGREPIMQLLKDAGVLDTLNPEELASLPKWQHVVDLYGDKVRIIGKERCKDFRNRVSFHDRKVGVAGLFNTGTNLLDLHLQRNVHGVENIWQVPWGKHRMAEVKWNHTADGLGKYKKENVLPGTSFVMKMGTKVPHICSSFSPLPLNSLSRKWL